MSLGTGALALVAAIGAFALELDDEVVAALFGAHAALLLGGLRALAVGGDRAPSRRSFSVRRAEPDVVWDVAFLVGLVSAALAVWLAPHLGPVWAIAVAAPLVLGVALRLWFAAARFAVAAFCACDVVVGRDGVTVERVSGTVEYAPYGRLERLELLPPAGDDGALAGPGSIVLGLRDDAPIRVRAKNLAEALALQARIRAALVPWSVPSAHCAPCPSSVPVELLERGARPLSSWKRAVRDFLRAVPSYRHRSVALAELHALVDSPHEPPSRRAAAAYCVAECGAPESERRLASAAEACAHPELRALFASYGRRRPQDALLASLTRSAAA